MKAIVRRLLAWRRLSRQDAALIEEIEHHRLLLQEAYEHQGLPAHDAEAASRRAMGNVALARDEARDVWIVGCLDRLARDVRYAARGLRREPTFALTTVLTLALGIATVTTVFSLADVELWKPLPFPAPGRLVAVYSRGPGSRAMSDPLPIVELAGWRAGAPAFQHLASIGNTTRRVLQGDTAESVAVAAATSNYFDTLGQRPSIGRTFHADDARGTRSVILTERAWQRLFDRAPSAVGRTVVLDGEAFAIVGVVDADTPLSQGVDFFEAIDERAGAEGQPVPRVFGAIGRLADGASPGAARAQLQALVDRRATGEAPGGHTVFVEDLREYYTVAYARPLYVLLAASLVVLLLSVANAATLLLGRAFRRAREFALRGALGGGRRAILGQLLAESALVAVPAGGIGLLLTSWSLGLLTPSLPPDLLSGGTRVPVDGRVAALAMAIVALTTAVFALVPMSLSRRIALSSALGPGVRATGTSDGLARRLLVGVQIALALVLACGAGLFVKSFVALTRAPLGFEPAGAVAVRATLSGPRYASDTAIRAYADAAVDEVRATPGVVSAAVGTSSPLGSGPIVFLADPRQPRPAAGEEPRAILRAVGPEYFHTLGIHLVEGRAFSSGDREGAPRVAMVNATLAVRLFGQASALGRQIEILPGARTPWKRPGHVLIVGVASNVKEVGVNEVEFADLYVPFAQAPAPSVEIVARTAVPSSSVIEALRRRAALVDKAIPIQSATTFEQRVASVLRGDRFNLLVIATFAGAALLLAAIGVYGAVAAYEQARTREFGVRLALGACPRQLVAAVLWRTGSTGMLSGACGVGIALALALMIGDGLYLVPGAHVGMLYGVKTTDPVMLAASFAGVVTLSLLAGAVPALRASRIDPVEALKE
jgi:putative ABC transport system permease protein